MKLTEAAFLRLRDVATTFDARLRTGLSDADLDALESLLSRLAANVGNTEDRPPWAGLADR